MCKSEVGIIMLMPEAPLFNDGVDVASCASCGAVDFSLQALLGDEADGFHFAFRNSSEPSFNNVYAEFV